MSENTHKQVILVRTDLKMDKGKVGAQVAHASMAAVLRNAMRPNEKTLVLDLDDRLGPWLSGAFTKVCLKVDNEKDLFYYYDLARQRGMLASVIRDSGRTVFAGVPTYTCVAIGPDNADEIDKITGKLKLL